MSGSGPSSGGWGGGPWGSTPWGGSSSGTLTVVFALAIAENVIQIGFSEPIYLSNLLDTPDGSDPAKYAASVVGGTGLDGSPARPVSVVEVTPSANPPPESEEGTFFDLTTDRPMTPYPALYSIACFQVFSADLSTEISSPSSASFYGVFKEILQPSIETPSPNRDFGNPQSLAGAAALPNPGTATLGVFNTDSTGDYAIDSGLVAYKKRVYRRLITKPGGFLHLGTQYGVGIPQQGKKLARASTIGKLSANAQTQIAQEPETEQVKVSGVGASDGTGLATFTILVKTKGGQTQKFTPQFSTQ